jgi:hypothetical protein
VPNGPAAPPEATRALGEFCAAFLRTDETILGVEPVAREAVPPPFDQLLVHESHMTARLRQYHGRPLALRVLEERQEGESYRRRITLVFDGTDRVVEVGLVWIDLRYILPVVQAEIKSKKTPLGDILMRGHVLRRIEPRFFYRFDPAAPLVRDFGRPLAGDAYGRLGVIHCDHQPAIHLLEIVSGEFGA